MKRAHWIPILAISLSLAACLSGKASTASSLYERKVLFPLRYGSSANEIKVAEDEKGILHGPSTLAVDGKGNVLIGLRNSRLIKKFSPDGHLQAMFACDAWALTADSEGNFYALLDNRDADGERRGLKVTKYDSRGKVIFSLFPDFFRSILGEADTQAEWPQGIETDFKGNLYCLFVGKIAKFSPSGQYLGLVSCPYLTQDGKYYIFSPVSAKPGKTIRIRKYSSKGYEAGKASITVHKPTLKKGEELSQVFFEEEPSTGTLAASWVDNFGNIYLTGVVETPEPVSLMNGLLHIPGRNVVQQYSSDGKYLTEIQFASEPSGEFPPYRITHKGEIYQLDYRSDHLDVVKWTPKKIVSPVSKSPTAKALKKIQKSTK